MLARNKNSLFSLKKDSASNFLLYSAVFFLGLGFHVVYVLVLLLFFAVKPSYLLRPTFRKSFLITFTLISLFLLPQYTIGYHQIEVDSPIFSLLSVMFSIVVFGGLLQQLSPIIIRNCIVILIVGIGVEALITIIYSLLQDLSYYGYGRLFNPIIDKEVNSPAAALKIACLASLCIWYILQQTVFLKKLLLLLFVATLTLLATWLASRAYFVITFLSLVLALILNFKTKNIVRVILFGTVGFLLFLMLFQNIDVSIFSRLNRLDGSLESARFLLWKDGFAKLLTHPVGGFSVDQTIDPVRWFHNVFLDSGRLAGWLPVFSLLIFTLYSFYLFLSKRNEHSLFAGFIFAIVFLLMQQDVVVEAMVRFLVLIYFCSILLGISRPLKEREFKRSKHA